ncbi:MAG: T9SS type A sorting domain-containing protein [Flavobacteriales bacterium]|nr:T9SS type A sorting domain-containing protein [Flavobacteriales bacterium]
MKKIYILLIVLAGFIFELNAQTVINEGFESGTFNTLISYQTVGTYTVPPGIINNTNFGSTKVFSFGKSTCGSSCFNNYKTTLTITFPTPTYVNSISWKEMEISGNWGSQGQVLLDNVAMGSADLGALPVNSTVPDATPRNKAYSINQTVTTIKLEVNDITNASEIIIDDLLVNYSVIPKIVGYEYWFNNDFANKTSTTISPVDQLNLNTNIPTNGLSNGIHTFNFRSWDNSSKYSSVVSQFFYKINPTATVNRDIVAYEYWFDNDYANVVAQTVTNQQQLNLSTIIATNAISNGVHSFNIRFKDNTEMWSSVLSQFFYKMPPTSITSNKITTYRYWFDSNFAQVNTVNLPTPVQQLNLIDDLDLTQLTKGIHTIHFQFKDSLNMWSVVTSDSINKMALPIANFNYTMSGNCDSTVVSFADNSIDGDTYLWNFGDGNNSNLTNPSHTYYNTGVYNVSLTVTDTLSGLDSTIVVPVSIYMKTSSSISATECDSYTAPDGAIYTTSGIKTAVIPNSVSCDSTITINLTIKQSTTSTINETACFSYTAPDGIVYTTSGVKTATIPNAVSCDSVITINLTINNVDNTVNHTLNTLTSNANAASYQWLDCDNGNSPLVGENNQSFTATINGTYAVQVTQNGCVDTSSCIVINTVGIINNTFKHDVVVYPNPTKGAVNIDLGVVYKNVTIEVYDVYGKLVLNQKYFDENFIQLNLNEPSGLYFVKLQSDDYRATIRVVKQ